MTLFLIFGFCVLCFTFYPITAAPTNNAFGPNPLPANQLIWKTARESYLAAQMRAALSTNGGSYVGCFVDSSSRTLPTGLTSNTASYLDCFQRARSLGFRYVGLQNFNGPGQCWGGNSLSGAKSLGIATNCALRETSDGSSDGSVFWAGGNANAVYDIGYMNYLGISLQSMTLTSAATNADGSIIYFGSSSGTFYAFTSTGVMKWFYPAQDAIYSTPTYSAGYVSFGSNDYFIYVLNATTGVLLWRYKTGFVVTGSPAFLTNATATTMFVGSQDYNMYAFRTTNPGWAVRNFTDTPNSPILSLDGTSSTPSALVGTGKYTLPYCQAMCTATNNCLYFIQDPVAHNCWLKSDYDYFTSTGTQVKGAYFKNYIKWTYATGGPIVSTPAVGTVSGVSAVFFGSTDFFIYALSASDSTLLWKFQTRGSVVASALVNPFNSATLYVKSRDLYLYALTTATGQVSWKANLTASATAGSGAGVYTTFEGLVSVETTYCGVTSMVMGDWTLAMSTTSCVALRSASLAASQSLSPQFPSGLMWALELINNKVTSGSGTVSVSKTYITTGKFSHFVFDNV